MAGVEFLAAAGIACGLGVEGVWEQFTKCDRRVGDRHRHRRRLFLLAGRTRKTMAFDHPADEKNPYAYAHTGEDILRPAGPRLEELRGNKTLRNPRIAVVAKDAWPLPWYLRKFSQVGFWQPDQETGPSRFFHHHNRRVRQAGGAVEKFPLRIFRRAARTCC